jgi:membrane associated rhomboid family serine protease
MARPSSVLCPSCGTLVGVKDAKCLNCGRLYPGMWGLTRFLKSTGDDMGFASLVIWVCAALYLACLAVDPSGISTGGILSLLSPSGRSLRLFGMSGAVPVFGQGKWWTVLSAAWLHAGILHILFNMYWVRDLAPSVARLYGPGRTVIIYTIASATGFLASSVVGAFIPLLGGAGFTLGASASICGLLGALYHYGRRGGSSMIGQQAKMLIIFLFVFGFVMPGVDNWAHLGGLGGGWVTAKVLDPLKPERGDHVLAALACLALSLLSIVASVLYGLGLLRP